MRGHIGDQVYRIFLRRHIHGRDAGHVVWRVDHRGYFLQLYAGSSQPRKSGPIHAAHHQPDLFRRGPDD